MRKIVDVAMAVCGCLAFLAPTVRAQSVDYASSSFLSTGGASGSDWNLWSNGYAGTFVHLDTPGVVHLSVNAAGQAADGIWPEMSLYVGDQSLKYTVSQSSFNNYTTDVTLPAGTFLIRTAFNNDSYNPGTGQDRNLLLRSLSVGAAGTGLQILNPASSADVQQASLDAADSYVSNYRKGDAAVTLTRNGVPLSAGTQVRVKLAQHAFDFGTAVSGAQQWGSTEMAPNPPPGSDAAKYQQMLASRFNMVVPENAGKWGLTEEARGVLTMDYVDSIMAFAKDHNMRARYHAVAWGQQQPQWVTDLENTALGSDPVASAAAAAELRSAISNRIGDVAGARSRDYVQLDGINESSHEAIYKNIFGNSGLASIYNETANALRSAGSDSKLYFNEYGVLNTWSGDAYGNWYRQHMQGIIDAGITPQNQQILGVGTQYYTSSGDHDPAQVYRVLNNLTASGMPVTLSEFGVADADSSSAPRILADTLRLTFGTQGTTSFLNWGFWQPSMWMKGAAFYDQNWNITETGKVWEQMMGLHDWGLEDVPVWTTDLTLTTDANGRINFNGFYGNYGFAVDGQTYAMALAQGQTDYSVEVPEPASLTAFGAAVILLIRRRPRAC